MLEGSIRGLDFTSLPAEIKVEGYSLVIGTGRSISKAYTVFGKKKSEVIGGGKERGAGGKQGRSRYGGQGDN